MNADGLYDVLYIGGQRRDINYYCYSDVETTINYAAETTFRNKKNVKNRLIILS